MEPYDQSSLVKVFMFCASHQLPNHNGKCRRLHGHNYQLTVRFKGTLDMQTGFVLDFSDISKYVKPVIDILDHDHLNYFIDNPTCEIMIRVIAGMLTPLSKLAVEKGGRLQLFLSETPATNCEYDCNAASDQDWLKLIRPVRSEPQSLAMYERYLAYLEVTVL